MFAYIPNLAIYLRFNSPKFSDVQITIGTKTRQHAPNPPKITGCFLLYYMYKQSGREFTSVPAFSVLFYYVVNDGAKIRKMPDSNKMNFFAKK